MSSKRMRNRFVFVVGDGEKESMLLVAKVLLQFFLNTETDTFKQSMYFYTS